MTQNSELVHDKAPEAHLLTPYERAVEAYIKETDLGSTGGLIADFEAFLQMRSGLYDDMKNGLPGKLSDEEIHQIITGLRNKQRLSLKIRYPGGNSETGSGEAREKLIEG